MNNQKKQKSKVVDDSIFGIGKRIVAPKEGIVNKDNPYLPKYHILACIIGKSGCGKTYYLLTLIPQIKISQLAIFSALDIPIYTEIKKYCEDNDIQFYKVTTIEEAEPTLYEMIENKPKQTYGLIIYDDWNVDMTTSRNNKYQKIMNRTNGIYRNYHYHQVYITQSAMMISTLSRNNCNLRVIFSMNDTYALDSIKKDFENITGRKKEDFEFLYQNYINKTPHSFLQIVDEKIFIYIPNKTKSLELVDFGDKVDLENDKELNKLCELYIKPKKSIIENHRRDMLKKQINNYIQYLMENNSITKEEINKFLHEKYNL